MPSYRYKLLRISLPVACSLIPQRIAYSCEEGEYQIGDRDKPTMQFSTPYHQHLPSIHPGHSIRVEHSSPQPHNAGPVNPTRLIRSKTRPNPPNLSPPNQQTRRHIHRNTQSTRRTQNHILLPRSIPPRSPRIFIRGSGVPPPSPTISICAR